MAAPSRLQTLSAGHDLLVAVAAAVARTRMVQICYVRAPNDGAGVVAHEDDATRLVEAAS